MPVANRPGRGESGARTWPALDVEPRPAASRQGDGSTVAGVPDAFAAALTDFNVAAVEEALDGSRWRVFFASEIERQTAARALATAFPELRFEAVDVPDEDWAARSQADLRAVQVGRVIVAPPWDVPTVVTIQPSTGFGTGHHPTTRLCLAALQQVGVRGRSVLDVGTGSAVLAIAASLLGAEEVTGIDDDPEAIRAAWDNLALNPAATVSLLTGDFRTTELAAADVVVANLTAALLVAAAPRFRRLVAAGGRLIVSGVQTTEEDAVRGALAAFSVDNRAEEEEWVCLTLA